MRRANIIQHVSLIVAAFGFGLACVSRIAATEPHDHTGEARGGVRACESGRDAGGRDMSATTAFACDEATVDWMFFVAERYPRYAPAAWSAYVRWRGWDDLCLDRGHEFWCRFGEGSCRRTGSLTCNDDGAWFEDAS